MLQVTGDTTLLDPDQHESQKSAVTLTASFETDSCPIASQSDHNQFNSQKSTETAASCESETENSSATVYGSQLPTVDESLKLLADANSELEKNRGSLLFVNLDWNVTAQTQLT